MIHIGKKFFDQKNLLFVISIVLLGFGRASAWVFLAPLTAVIGYACAFAALSHFSTLKSRLFAGWALFTAAILLQSSWFLSHPYSYIVGVWIALCLLLALPYAGLSLLVISDSRRSLLSSAGLAAAFTLVEWGFTCLPCGYSFQCAALALSWSLWPLQLASVIGAIGLSFFVFWTNILVYYFCRNLALPAVIIALLPYLLGGGMYWHGNQAQQTFDIAHPPYRIGVCHMEEPPDVYSRALAPEQLHEQEWQKILALVSPLTPGQADLIILPEGVAPYSADSPLFKASHLKGRWKAQITMPNRFLSSIDLAQMVATTVRACVLIGLEGRGVDSTGEVTAYNSCFFVPPSPHHIMRYDKQLLLPLGEYIPFSFLRSYLASYGIHDSFSPGKCPVLFNEGGFRLSPLICYEETFSSYAVAASRLQPNLLVTLSNDCWYPSVRREHFELARLRTVEMGIRRCVMQPRRQRGCGRHWKNSWMPRTDPRGKKWVYGSCGSPDVRGVRPT